MRHPLLMFEELPDWDDLEVRVVIEVEDRELVGSARGNVVEESRLDIVARAALDAAQRAAGRRFGELGGIALGEVGEQRFVVAVVKSGENADPLVGAAPLRHFEDDAQGVIRAVFDAINRKAGDAERP
jgi:hypothetical protein